MNKYSKIIVPAIYISVGGMMTFCIMTVVNGVKNYLTEPPEYNYSIKDVFEEDIIPVINTDNDLIVRPYNSDKVKIGKPFYDYKESKENQMNSLIYYQNTYIQNTGVDYISEEEFNIISILDGEVISVEKNEIYENVIKIKHNDNTISIYSNVKDVLVSVGYKVTKGEIIATSTKSKIDTNIKSMLHFEIYFKGSAINPENLYTLKVSELE